MRRSGITILIIALLSATVGTVYFVISSDSRRPVEVSVNDLLGRMTMEEKIGQMALVEKNSIINPGDLAEYGIGAVLSGGGANPLNNTPEGWREMVSIFQTYSQKSRLGISLLYGVDANHGHGNLPGATIFPHFIGLGASGDPGLVRAVAQATAEEVAATGIYWIFSPDLDVVQDTRWGRTYETFGSDPQLVAELGKAYVEGVQSVRGDGVGDGFAMAATAKHFIGNGSAEWGSSIKEGDYFIDQGNINISEEQLRAKHLEPFSAAVEADVKAVMIGLNSWHGQKISTNRYLITDVLRGELGFQGLILSDWYGVYEQEDDPYGALVESVNAGIDLVMLPYDFRTFIDYMKRAVANGDISEERLDEAVGRILSLKYELGLFDKRQGGQDVWDRQVENTIGSARHRGIAREAVRKSLVLLKDDGVFPISKTASKILVAGSAADNLGIQSGGWTVEWQGIDGNWIPGTTILAGIREAVSAGSEVIYDAGGNFAEDVIGGGDSADGGFMADVGIAVVGEKPYAEGVGDEANPSLTEEDLEAIKKLKQSARKIVVIVVSGRPLDIKKYSDDWDAVVAAWLPGTEGQGVADVIFGDFPFTGRLPVEWEI